MRINQLGEQITKTHPVIESALAREHRPQTPQADSNGIIPGQGSIERVITRPRTQDGREAR